MTEVVTESTEKKQYRICKLPNGRKIYKGDKVFLTIEQKEVTAKACYFEDDGDKFLTFEEGGEALVEALSPYWKSTPHGANIHLR